MCLSENRTNSTSRLCSLTQKERGVSGHSLQHSCDVAGIQTWPQTTFTAGGSLGGAQCLQGISMRAPWPLKYRALRSLRIKKCSIQPSYGRLVFNRDLSILNPFKAVSKNHNLNSCRQMSWAKYEDYLKGSPPACPSVCHLLICLTWAIAFLFPNITRPGLHRRVRRDQSFPGVLHAAGQPQPGRADSARLQKSLDLPMPSGAGLLRGEGTAHGANACRFGGGTYPSKALFPLK